MIRQVARDVGWKKQQAEARMLVQDGQEVYEYMRVGRHWPDCIVSY